MADVQGFLFPRTATVGKAGPRLEPGGRFGATLAASDRRLIEATFTITGPADDAGFVNALPMVHHRWFPAIESDGTDALDEVVTMSGYDGEVGRSFTGTFDLRLYDSPVEELTLLAPVEPIAGYWREVAVSWRGGTTLERRPLPAVPGVGEGA